MRKTCPFHWITISVGKMTILRGTKCFIRSPRSPSHGLQHSRQKNPKDASATPNSAPELRRSPEVRRGHHGIRMDSGDRPMRNDRKCRRRILTGLMTGKET